MASIHSTTVVVLIVRDVRLSLPISIPKTGRRVMVRRVGLGCEFILKIGEMPLELFKTEVLMSRRSQRLQGGGTAETV